jgi:DNA-binding NarL/FixJ family response regulator
MPKNPSRILVIDPHPVVRRGMVAILTPSIDHASITGCGTFSDALQYLQTHPVDLVISDFRIDGDTALSFLRNPIMVKSGIRCLVFSALDEVEIGYPCIRAGACGFLSKSAPPAQIVEAARTVRDGRHYVSERLSKALMNGQGSNSVPSPGTQLTRRELEIFSLIGGSMPVSKIAAKLGLSVKTVEAHRDHIKNKLGHPSAAHLAAAAAKWLDQTSFMI